MVRAQSLHRWLALSISIALSGCAHTAIDGPYVAKLDLRGVHNVSAWKLEHGLASRPLSFWQHGARRAFDELELERDRTRVQRFYESEGYYAAKVVLAKGTPEKNGNGVDVVIAVEEGPPTLIGDVKVFGLDSLDDKTRRRIQQYQLGLRRGQVFHHADYEHFKESLSRELAKRGVHDTKVDGVVDVAPESNLAYITVTFHPEGK